MGSINIIAFCGLALAACSLIVVIRQYKPEYALPVSIAAAVVLLSYLLLNSEPIIGSINRLSQMLGDASQYVSILLKALGICLIAQLSSDICRDCGENSLAGRIETGGKIAVLIIALPIFEDVLSISTGLIKK